MRKRLTSHVAPVVAAALVIAACGSDDTPGPASAGTEVPAASSDARADDGADDGPPDLIEPQPIEVVAAGSSSSAAIAGEASAIETDSGAATGGLSVVPWAIDYAVDESMPELPSDDSGYWFDGAVDATADQVGAVAAAFGVTGDPVRLDEGFDGAWRVGPDDGSAPAVWVFDDGVLNWSYTVPWPDDALVACSVSVDADGSESSDCPEPEPPVGVPSADEAEQLAAGFLSRLGLDPTGLTIESFADDWFANVNASDDTDPRAAVRRWHFGFGADGVLQHASGSLGAPQPAGPFPLIDIDTAVARLGDGFFSDSGGLGSLGGVAPDIAVVSGPAPESGEATEPVSSLPPDAPVSSDESIVVTLVDVQADLWWAWAADGSAWLLPAYRFVDADGGWHVAPAVADEYLIRPEPVDPGAPIPVEPGGGIGDGAAPPPTLSPEPDKPVQPVEPSEPVNPGDDPEGALPFLEELVGLSTEEFTAEAESIGFTVRAVMIDGERLSGTADYRTDRVNVVIEGPRVIAIESIG